jgi:predicted Zn-ribbon and HTH transcriptional regulator
VNKTVATKWSEIPVEKKRSAHVIYAAAIKAGTLIRKTECEDCGSTSDRKLHGHHEDYDKPLDVVWLCHPCHRRRHSYIMSGLKIKSAGAEVRKDINGVPVIVKRKCLRCAYAWFPKKPQPPRVCPSCKSAWWDALLTPQRGGFRKKGKAA